MLQNEIYKHQWKCFNVPPTDSQYSSTKISANRSLLIFSHAMHQLLNGRVFISRILGASSNLRESSVDLSHAKFGLFSEGISATKGDLTTTESDFLIILPTYSPIRVGVLLRTGSMVCTTRGHSFASHVTDGEVEFYPRTKEKPPISHWIPQLQLSKQNTIACAKEVGHLGHLLFSQLSRKDNRTLTVVCFSHQWSVKCIRCTPFRRPWYTSKICKAERVGIKRASAKFESRLVVKRSQVYHTIHTSLDPKSIKYLKNTKCMPTTKPNEEEWELGIKYHCIL